MASELQSNRHTNGRADGFNIGLCSINGLGFCYVWGCSMKQSLAVISGSKGKPTFAKLSRQCTGSHMLDSGGATGRYWQRPLPKNECYLELNKITRSNGETEYSVLPYMPLHSFLENRLTIDMELTRKLRKLEAKEGTRFNCMVAAEQLAKALGFRVTIDGDNSYNYDNDLTQGFQYAVIDEKYSDTELVLLETHNGADIRGGYSDVVVCRPKDDITSLLDLTCGISILSGFNPDGSEMSPEDMQSLDECWQVGYSSRPSSKFNEQIESIVGDFENYSEVSEVTVKLKSGHIVTVYPSAR